MRTTLKQTLAGAWMLLAALALSTAGCSQLEDAPDTGNRPGIATGNEPISISIAPKPGFEAGDAETRSGDAETRSTVGSDGAFAWQDTDLILVSLTFDDHKTNPTVFHQRWVKSSTATTPVAGWTVYGSWKYDDLTALTTMNWPVGASKCTVQAFTTNCSHKTPTNDGLADFTYKNGMGDHMFFTGEFTVGTPLKVDFKHSTTRVTFAGLKASTKYRLLVNGVEPTFATSFKKKGFELAGATAQTFTTGAAATSFTICLPLTPATVADATIGIAAGEVKLTLLKVNADDTTTTPINEAILKATGSAPNWVMNGNRYTVNVKEYAGGIDPDTDGNLLPEPGPVVEGTTVHEISGYYITQTEPDSEITKYFTQTAAMQVCKDLGKGWYLPSMKDYETMMGWGTINPFTGNNDETTYKMGTDYTIMKSAFSLKPSTMSYFWSSTLNTKTSGEAWIIGIGDGADGKGDGNYLSLGVNDDYLVESVRCVQRKP